MTEKLARAKGRHIGLATYLKSLTSELNEYISSGSCEQVKLLGLKSTLLKNVEQYSIVHEEILSLIDTESVGTEVISHMKSLEPSYRVLARTDVELEKIKCDQTNSTATYSAWSVGGNNTVSPQIYCKLPKITLPQFTGDPLAWQGFWDQYQVSVHNNVSISDIDKFNYLKGCLKGEAGAAISGLSLSSENYKEAVSILRDRFGNEQVLISALMESLLKIDKIRSAGNIKVLRMLYTHVANCCRNLKSLKLNTSGYGSLLIPILKDRLPA
jgi:hypothetical protein